MILQFYEELKKKCFKESKTIKTHTFLHKHDISSGSFDIRPA